jgi:TolA-binding protein
MKRSFVKTGIFFTALIFLITFAACSGNSAEEIFKTAQFEELQNNKEHAEELYSEIIHKYPDSKYAKRAKERVSELKK